MGDIDDRAIDSVTKLIDTAHNKINKNRGSMRYEFTSSTAAMAANGNLSEITPWRIIIDTVEQTITVSKRNKFLIGTDEETLALLRFKP